MGLSVISSMPKGVTPTASSQNNAIAEGLPGDFASILSGELLGAGRALADISGNTPGLREPVAELSGKRLIANQPKSDSKPLPEELLTETTNSVDPSILASLSSNLLSPPGIRRDRTIEVEVEVATETPDKKITDIPGLPPGSQPLGIIGLQVATEKIERRITELSTSVSDADAALNRPGELNAKTRSPETLGVFDKLASTVLRANQSGTPGNEAASFAAEGNTLETSNTAQAGPYSTHATLGQSREALAANQSNIQTHFRESSWSQQFGDKIVWLAKNDQQSAKININPPELGPVQITISMNGDQAKVLFASPHAEVRQAIEGALPQLKEMLSSAGINLGQTNVGANLAQQNPDNPYHAPNAKRMADENAILPGNDKTLSVSTISTLQRGRGLVDLFA